MRDGYKSYGVTETKYTSVNTLCHVARNAHNVLAVKSLCGVALSWMIGDYRNTPSGWNLCQRCHRTIAEGVRG